MILLLTGATALAELATSAAAVTGHRLAPALVAVLVLLPVTLIEPLLDVLGAALRWPRLAQALRRVASVTGPVPWRVAPGALDPLPRVDRITLDGVAAGYPGSPSVLSDVTMDVSRGRHLVVSGPSGSGKSTLLAVLLRYLDPTAGLYFLERSAQAVAPTRVRAAIAWCPQDAHLFDSSLRGNLLLARAAEDRPTDDELLRALSAVGLDGLLAELPAGLDASVGPGGRFLSGGQRQRVSGQNLARPRRRGPPRRADRSPGPAIQSRPDGRRPT